MPIKGKPTNDLTGLRFGRLVALKPTKKTHYGYYWMCQCDCGGEVEVITTSLTRGISMSCGCLRSYLLNPEAVHLPTVIKHGLFGTRIYMIYHDMIRRCYSKNREHYRAYGGRGITVCDEWRSDVTVFVDWAYANGYSDELTIERDDVDGNYEPSNCRWIPMSEQHLNTQLTKKKTGSSMNRDIAEQVTSKILADMSRLGSNWMAPWVGSGLARNFVTMKPYKGVNVAITGAAGFTSPFFGSFKQWGEAGAQVLKGSKATHVIFWKQIAIEDKETGKDKVIPLLRTIPLFNQEQTDGKGPALKIELRSPIERHELCDKLIWECGVPITHHGDKAFYSPSSDHITLPKPEQFKNREGYYGTALHEEAHATGHASRLDRKLTGRFGSPDYSFEELIAETASALVCVSTGITKEPREDHAKYLNSWMRGLKSDSRSILQAFSKAQAAADWILGERPGATPEPTPARPDGQRQASGMEARPV